MKRIPLSFLKFFLYLLSEGLEGTHETTERNLEANAMILSKQEPDYIHIRSFYQNASPCIKRYIARKWAVYKQNPLQQSEK